MNRFVRPDTTVLTLENGDTLIVKTRLNTGETRAMRSAILAPDDEQSRADRTAFSVVVAYLLDWTLTDGGRPVAIRDQPVAVVRSALDALDYDSFIEIANLIGDHVQRQNALRSEEKKTPTTETPSSAISPSPFAAAGATNG